MIEKAATWAFTAAKLAVVDAALDNADKVVQQRTPRRVSGRAVRFGQAALAAFDDSKLHRVRQDQSGVLQDQLSQRLLRRQFVAPEHGLGKVACPGGDCLGERFEHRLLAREVVVDRRARDADRVGDVVHVGAAESLLDEQLRRSVQDRLALGLAACRSRLRSSSAHRGYGAQGRMTNWSVPHANGRAFPDPFMRTPQRLQLLVVASHRMCSPGQNAWRNRRR